MFFAINAPRWVISALRARLQLKLEQYMETHAHKSTYTNMLHKRGWVTTDFSAHGLAPKMIKASGDRICNMHIHTAMHDLSRCTNTQKGNLHSNAATRTSDITVFDHVSGTSWSSKEASQTAHAVRAFFVSRTL